MNLNLKIIILISLVGIFTVSSFIFDQMVIYSEDKIREKNFLYKRSFNNYQSSKNIMIMNVTDLSTSEYNSYYKTYTSKVPKGINLIDGFNVGKQDVVDFFESSNYSICSLEAFAYY